MITARFPPPACKPKNLIVEIGHGESPIWRTFRKLPLADQSYLGLDISSQFWPHGRMPLYHLDAGRAKIAARAVLGHDCRFMLLDGSGELPVENCRSSEVYLSLVLNDPRIPIQVVARLIGESARITKPGGYLVIDNGCTPCLADAGDVLVSDGGRNIVFKASRGRDLTEEDSTNPASAFLNGAFLPMEPSFYPEYLRSRGLPDHFDIKPGYSISILVRR